MQMNNICFIQYCNFYYLFCLQELLTSLLSWAKLRAQTTVHVSKEKIFRAHENTNISGKCKQEPLDKT